MSDFEVNAIIRPGSRKAPYWCRHLHDLQGIVEWHKQERAKRLDHAAS